ncbi:Tripartite tricarboxylate transporter family receptor [Marinomonas gallaica]|uniref:Tripartite tricarboxylate transporter family receptor n=1 Tax=Marinomonas gallaica TaxID=1806667 RepID=A0A1C3JPI3_9GAMM|nr:tripartite tricarboxylate transporter substrate binding protein [Marinomonas gallaica]SBT16929.1 Tripartite tricarboxylate transporter family receptor [Marinomonas gallaica]SBT22120.1 Tripartite tricarboxylate transporter family receptor [Marinomonas gallaica]
MKTLISAIAGLALSTSVLADYPNKDIQGIIQWGAGGSTDTVMRSVSPYAEEVLGTDIILTNRTGGVGAIATKLVNAKKADGYTLLMGAENPQMYKVLGLANLDYSDMIPINVLARGIPMFVAQNDAPFDTMQEMIDYIQANPGQIKVGSTGKGGLASIVMAMVESEVDLDVTTVPYNGDGPALTALQGGAIDVMPAVLGAAIQHINAGRMKAITLVDDQVNPVLPDTAAITDALPNLAKYLPFGPFFGVFVKQGTPEEAVTKLTEAFAQGANKAEFQRLMESRGYGIMNLSGQPAVDFLENYRSVSSWLVHDAGFAKHSPAEFDIPRP